VTDLTDLLRGLLDEQLRAARAVERDGHVATSPFYASGALGCHRARWYQANGVRGDESCEPDMQAILAMDTGTYLHDRLQEALKATGAVSEVTWRLDHLGGRADLLWPGPSPVTRAHRAVGEIKTLSNYGFRRACKVGPEDRHVLQAMLSCRVLDALGALVIYISRDSFELASWWLDYNSFWRDETKWEIERIEALAGKEDRPLRLVWPDLHHPITVRDPAAPNAPWQCRYCWWRETCTKDGP
jgi:hypothetical protein